MTKKKYYVKKSENQKEFLVLDKEDNHCVCVLNIEQINQGIKDWINDFEKNWISDFEKGVERMTERTRFIYKDNSMWFSFIDRQTGKQLNAIMCCNLMNELHEENERLKKENQELHKLNQEYINNLSDEKKETLSEILNAILGDDDE